MKGKLTAEDVQAARDYVTETPDKFPPVLVDKVGGVKRRKREASGEVLAVAKMDEDIRTADELYGDGMPYELERIENEVRFYQDQAGAALLEMGRRLIRIKAHEGHGKFVESLERLDMAYRSAAYAMTAARKFSNVPTLAHLGSSKIKALTVLDDDEVQELEKGGKAKGMTLDDIDRMTMRELRSNLRKANETVKKEKEARRQDRDAQEKAIAQKEAKINELDQQLRYQQPPTKEQLAIAELAGFDDRYFHELAAAMGAIRKAVGIIERAQCVPGANAQILSEWMRKYNDEMILLNGVHAELCSVIDNLHPVAMGEYGEAAADEPELG